MALYPGAQLNLLPENETQSAIKPRTVCLHTAVSNGNSLFDFWMSDSSAGVESHMYLQKSGDLEQYMNTLRRADCQNDGNSFCISVESWDGARVVWDPRDNEDNVPPWNTAQVVALVKFLAWCHRVHDIPLRISRYWNDSGIAWHNKYIGRPGFARSARLCPGKKRIAQIPGIITLAIQQEEDMPLTNDDLDKIDARTERTVERLLTRKRGEYGYGSDLAVSIASAGAWKYSWGGLRVANRIEAKQNVILEAIKNIPGVDVEALAEAIERLDAEAVAEQLEITVKEETP